MKIGARTIKTAIAAPAAIIIANAFGLDHAVSAGIIAILSIQNTKKKTLDLTIGRILSTLVALILSSVLFKFFNFSPIVFGLFLVMFIPITVKLNQTDNIAVSAVLVTHILLAQTITSDIFFNELGLMLIGSTLGVIANLHMPNNAKYVRANQADIDATIKLILYALAGRLKSSMDDDYEHMLFQRLNTLIKEGLETAIRLNENSMVSRQSIYYIQYMEMRRTQQFILKSLRKDICQVTITSPQAIAIADFTALIADRLNEKNDAIELIDQLINLMNHFKTQPLPDTRELFESRANLFHYLNDLLLFLHTKRQFIETYQCIVE